MPNPRPACGPPPVALLSPWPGIPVCVLGSQQPEAALVGKHVFILEEEPVGAQGVEQREDLGEQRRCEEATV